MEGRKECNAMEHRKETRKRKMQTDRRCRMWARGGNTAFIEMQTEKTQSVDYGINNLVKTLVAINSFQTRV